MSRKKNKYIVDMNGIYKKDLDNIKYFTKEYLQKKYSLETIINKIHNNFDLNNNENIAIYHYIYYLEYNDDSKFIIRRKPDNKSKLWNHITNYTLKINSIISLFD